MWPIFIGRQTRRFPRLSSRVSLAAGISPIVQALLGKGAALGTVLAFMMSDIALSLPEVIIYGKSSSRGSSPRSSAWWRLELCSSAICSMRF